MAASDSATSRIRATRVTQTPHAQAPETGGRDHHDEVTAQVMRAPPDLGRREQRMAERLVLRHEEPAGEPFTDHDAAEDRERHDGDRRVRGNRHHAS